MLKIKIFVVIIALFQLNCGKKATEKEVEKEPIQVQEPDTLIEVGAARFDEYVPLLEGKNIALLVNQTSRVGEEHLVDLLLEKGIAVKKIFAPEHGFRGTADAGEQLKDGKDEKTGLPVISLYGKKKKPSADDLAGIDWVIFDIQDVGARFYTYISSMHYLMEACAEFDLPLLILDRPNPNGHYVDGPILDPAYQSFVGMHPVPIVHGMTVGEYAKMINGEAWLGDEVQCDLSVVICANYTHQQFYHLPIKPSPNLPNMQSIYLYPSLCFFEGTKVSVGRGTNRQFQIYGHPSFDEAPFNFTPEPKPGARYPKLEGKKCNGYNLSGTSLKELQGKAQLDLSYLLNAYEAFPDKEAFFNKNLFFDKLAGGTHLREAIRSGQSEETIRSSWQNDLAAFRQLRSKYLLYEE